MTKNDCFYGIYPIRLVGHGDGNYPDLVYKKHSFNYRDVENLFFEIYRSEPEYLMANLTTENSTHAAFSAWIKKNGKRVKKYLNYRIELEKYEK